MGRLLDQRAAKLAQGAALLVADFGFRSAVSSNDQATITSALENHGARIDASLVALLDTTFAVRTHGQPEALSQAATLLPALAALPAGTGELPLGGSTHLARTLPVAVDKNAQHLVVSLTGLLAKAVAPFEALQLMLGALTLLGLVLFGMGSAWLARRVTQPLHHLVKASERLGRGDYDTPLLHTGRHDEIGDLAKAFEHMRLNIGQQQTEIRQLAYWDRLTGRPNRAQFRDTVHAAALRGEPMAVVMLDLDRFKHVNDVLGYAFGDRLLQGVAQRLRAAVRPGDVVARLGGG